MLTRMAANGTLAPKNILGRLKIARGRNPQNLRLKLFGDFFGVSGFSRWPRVSPGFEISAVRAL